jgi:hypothetical protein
VRALDGFDIGHGTRECGEATRSFEVDERFESFVEQRREFGVPAVIARGSDEVVVEF